MREARVLKGLSSCELELGWNFSCGGKGKTELFSECPIELKLYSQFLEKTF